MLYAVLSVRFVCKYAGEVREIYSFFSVGKKREGKCSFCFLSAKSVGQKQNVHFPLRWAISFAFSVTKEEWSTRRKNVVCKRKNISFKRSNIIYNHENMIYKGKNIALSRANIIYNRKNIKKS